MASYQAASAVDYIKAHAKDDKPFFMYVAFMKLHNPNNPAPEWKGKSHLSPYLDALMELNANTGKVVNAIKETGVENNTIVLWTADNGPWVDAYPDAGFTPFRSSKGTTFEGGFRVPTFMWAPGRLRGGVVDNDIIGHIDAWPTLAAMAGIAPPPHGAWKDNAGQPIYFDGIDQAARIEYLARPRNVASGELVGGNRTNPDITVEAPRTTWVYMRGLDLQAIRYNEWKWTWSAQDAWLGPTMNMGLPAIYNLNMDPAEEFDMTFNGAAPKAQNQISSSPGRWSGQDGGWTVAVAGKIMGEVVQSFKDFPNIPTMPAGASLGADIPEFVRPDILSGKYPNVPDAVKNMKLHPPKP